MENEKRKNSLIVILLTIIVLLILAIIGVFLSKSNTNDSDNNSNNNLGSIKLDDNKDYIYDAPYKIETIKESYYGLSDHSQLVKSSDLIVPYVNINTADADKVNKELLNLHEELISDFNDNALEEIFIRTVKYETTMDENSNILSIVVTTESIGTDIPSYKYYTYNFDLDSGNLLDYDGVIKKLKETRENMNSQVKKAIDDYVGANLDENLRKVIIDGSEVDTTIASYNEFENSVLDDSVLFFINNDKNISIIAKIFFNAGKGYNYQILNLSA